MLTIVDLHQEQELSSASMGAVAGGMSCEQALGVAALCNVCGDIYKTLGENVEAAAAYGKAQGVLAGACTT